MKDNKIPSPLVSLLPVFVLILLLFVTIRTFGSDALSGGSQVCLLVATAVCVLIGMAGFLVPVGKGAQQGSVVRGRTSNWLSPII